MTVNQPKGLFFIHWKSIIVVILTLGVNIVHAQDPQLTQFYAAPTYLNPAFAGATPCWRAGLNYRNQWFLGPRPYTTYMAWLDKNLRKIRSGVGGYIYYDGIGSGAFQTYEFAAQFAHEININDDLKFRLGIQPSYHLKYYTLGTNFSYGDEYTNLEGRVNGTSDAANIPGSLQFFDLSSGALVYSEKFWLGFASHHMLRPFFGPTRSDRVPIKFSVHGGFKIQLNDYYESILKPAFQVRSQAGNLQTDLGVYYERDKLILGAWYRGIPVLSTDAAINQDAFAIMGGVKIQSFQIAYSYDLPITKMIYTYGSHELSAIFEFCIYRGKRKPPRNVQQLPCPVF
ncbi:MAG: type IX secretion system membrane protein PorP/SprF [Bacteroidota bacterium]|nr:type IX secretion system membrane protein PorP/SprF [Bacteroidota bacterium]